MAITALTGWRRGLIAGGLALAGFVAGALIGSRLAPLALPDGSASPYAPVLALGGGVLLGSLISGLLERAGFVVRRSLIVPGLKAIDGMLGAVLGAAVGLAVMWVAGAVALQTPGARELRRSVQESLILRSANALVPPAGVLNALARFDPGQSIAGPDAGVGAPAAAIARDPQVRAAAGSVVKVQGTACGLSVEGSGWVAGRGLVVTNAHVVAGQDRPVVRVQGRGLVHDARIAAVDGRNDIAVLSVPDLRAAPLPLAEGTARAGASAAILGFPLNGPYDVRAARVGRTRGVLTRDAYDRGPVPRTIVTFRGLVRPGNSGGPIVDARGRVVGTVFAAASGRSRVGYAVPNEIVRAALAKASAARAGADSGPCTG